MSSMSVLDISRNLLTGTIPTQFGQFYNSLRLYRTPSVSLPDHLHISRFLPLDPSLATVCQEPSPLSWGTSPTWSPSKNLFFFLHFVWDLTSVFYCSDFSYNALTGTLPAELGDSYPYYLLHLSLNNNQLSGSIPDQYFNLPHLLLL